MKAQHRVDQCSHRRWSPYDRCYRTNCTAHPISPIAVDNLTRRRPHTGVKVPNLASRHVGSPQPLPTATSSILRMAGCDALHQRIRSPRDYGCVSGQEHRPTAPGGLTRDDHQIDKSLAQPVLSGRERGQGVGALIANSPRIGSANRNGAPAFAKPGLQASGNIRAIACTADKDTDPDPRLLPYGLTQ